MGVYQESNENVAIWSRHLIDCFVYECSHTYTALIFKNMFTEQHPIEESVVCAPIRSYFLVKIMEWSLSFLRSSMIIFNYIFEKLCKQ